MAFDVIDISIMVYAPDKSALCRQFPHLGSQFASLCRSTACNDQSRECGLCREQKLCDWHYIFSQSYSDDAFVLKRYQKPALPFAFSFPWINEQHGKDPGGGLEFRLAVLGRAIPALEMLLNGFVMLMETAAFAGCRIEGIGSRDLQGDVKPLYLGSSRFCEGNLSVLSSEWIMDSCATDCSRLEITLLSPLKLVSEGKPATDFSFSHFARSVMRRVSSLAYYYCDYEFDVNFSELSQQVSDAACIRNSCLYSGNGKLSGIVGSGLFEGDLEGIVPFLKLGSFFNIGKMSAFGMGSYNIKPQNGFCHESTRINTN